MFGKHIELKKLNTNNVRYELNKKGYNDIDLCNYYMPEFKKVGQAFNSNLRHDDNNASLNTIWTKSGNIQISDFGYKTGLNIFGYIREKENCSYLEALDEVCKSFKLDNISPYSNRKRSSRTSKLPSPLNIRTQIKQEVSIFKKSCNFTKEDKNYWDQFGITLRQLKTKRIQAISAFQIINPNKNTDFIINTSKDLAYSYPERKGNEELYKIYLPEGLKKNKDFKWFSNIPNKIIFNLRFLPKGSIPLLIIQSSFKDVMVMENFGYHSVPLNGEGMWFNDGSWKKLKLKAKTIIYFGDNDSEKEDNPGLTLSKKWSEKYEIDYITTPDNTASDISDYYKKYGKENTKKLLNELLNKYEK